MILFNKFIIVFYALFTVVKVHSNINAYNSFEPVQVMCEVNGYLIPAIIDTGAEITVMTASCAKRCHLSNMIDTQYSGRAVGVGHSEILGGIEGLPLRIGPLTFQNKVSILSNSHSRCDFLIGLDVLRRFDCDLSLRDKLLKLHVRGNEVRIPLLASSQSNSNTQSKASSYSDSDSTNSYEAIEEKEPQFIGTMHRGGRSPPPPPLGEYREKQRQIEEEMETQSLRFNEKGEEILYDDGFFDEDDDFYDYFSGPPKYGGGGSVSMEGV